MFERFTQSARVAVEDARYEAVRRGDRRIGTDHLLLALLQDESLSRVVGVDNQSARAAADQLDCAALASIGLDVDEVPPIVRPRLGKHMSITAGAKTVIAQSLSNAAAEKARRIASRHLMLALLDRNDPDPVATLFAALAVDRTAVSERLSTRDRS